MISDQPNLDSLIPELKLALVQYLEPEDLGRLEIANKKWYEFAKDPIIWIRFIRIYFQNLSHTFTTHTPLDKSKFIELVKNAQLLHHNPQKKVLSQIPPYLFPLAIWNHHIYKGTFAGDIAKLDFKLSHQHLIAPKPHEENLKCLTIFKNMLYTSGDNTLKGWLFQSHTEKTTVIQEVFKIDLNENMSSLAITEEYLFACRLNDQTINCYNRMNGIFVKFIETPNPIKGHIKIINNSIYTILSDKTDNFLFSYQIDTMKISSLPLDVRIKIHDFDIQSHNLALATDRGILLNSRGLTAFKSAAISLILFVYRYLIIGYESEKIEIWDWKKQTVVNTLPIQGKLTCLKYIDGKLITSTQKELCIWNFMKTNQKCFKTFSETDFR